MDSSIGFIGRSQAWSLALEMFRNLQGEKISDYTNFKPARIWSEASLATTPVDSYFLQSPTGFLGNHEAVNQLGAFFFIGTDVRVAFAEADGDLPTLADNALIAWGSFLNLEVEGRTFINKEPMYNYSMSLGLHQTTAASTLNSMGYVTTERHHDLIPVIPNQQVKAWIQVNAGVLDALTAVTKARIEIWGWKFQRPSAG